MNLTWTPRSPSSLNVIEPARVLVNFAVGPPGPKGEQGEPGVYIGPTFTAAASAPVAPAVGDVWLDTSGA